MSNVRLRPAASAILVLHFCTAAPAAAARLPIPNDGNWKKYFTPEELAASEKAVGKLIIQLEKGGADETAIAGKIGQNGALAIPALVELCGKREMGLLAGTHGGPVLLPKYHPECARANRALSSIRDAGAKSALLRIKDDSHLGAAAMVTLLEIGTLTAAELTSLIDSPRGIRYGHEELLNKRIMELPPDDRATLLIHLLTTTGFSGATANVVTGSEQALKAAQLRIDQLAQTPSLAAKNFLTSQLLGLEDDLVRTRYESQSPQKMAWYSDEGRRKIREKLAKLPAHIGVVESALARCSLSLPDTSGIVIGPHAGPGGPDTKWSETYTLPFIVWSRASNITISATIDRIPIDDSAGKIWDLVKINLPKGADFPFEQRIDIRWTPLVKPNVMKRVNIEIWDEAGNSYKASIFPRVLSYDELSGSGTNGVESPK